MSHVFDLATQWGATSRNVLITQGWYAIPGDDGGSDDDYGNWDIDSASWHAGDPETYPRIPYDEQDASLCNGGYRYIGSKLRPLTGLYSDSGRDAASLAHIDRELAVVRRAGDPRGRIDVVACTMGHLAFTTFSIEEGDAGFMPGLDLRYRHLDKMLERANAAGLTNCVTANYEAYYIWQFLSGTYSNKVTRLGAVASDMANLAATLAADDAAFRLDGRPVIFWYEGTLTEDITPAEWDATMDVARGASGVDFYVVGRNYGGSEVSWLDGLFPWIRYQNYLAATGTAREKAAEWAEVGVTSFIQSAVTNNPSRVALGNFSPGFEDYVLEWGAGNTTRAIPRNTDTIRGQFDGYEAIESGWQRLDGLVCVTWNGYPEGHCIEPTVQDNGEFLGLWTELVAAYEGDTPDPDETAALLSIWQDAPKDITCPIQQTQPGPQVRKARRIAHRGPA